MVVSFCFPSKPTRTGHPQWTQIYTCLKRCCLNHPKGTCHPKGHSGKNPCKGLSLPTSRAHLSGFGLLALLALQVGGGLLLGLRLQRFLTPGPVSHSHSTHGCSCPGVKVWVKECILVPHSDSDIAILLKQPLAVPRKVVVASTWGPPSRNHEIGPGEYFDALDRLHFRCSFSSVTNPHRMGASQILTHPQLKPQTQIVLCPQSTSTSNSYPLGAS